MYKTPKDLFGYAEEYIIVKDIKDSPLLKFSLSNKLDDIEMAILNRTGHDIDLKNAHWKINTDPSIYVKRLMNKHRVKYSMTAYEKNKNKQIVVNMSLNNTWLITGFDELDGTLYSWDKIETFKVINKVWINLNKNKE